MPAPLVAEAPVAGAPTVISDDEATGADRGTCLADRACRCCTAAEGEEGRHRVYEWEEESRKESSQEVALTT